MCGRYALARDVDVLVREYHVDQVCWDDDPPPRDYNIAPTKAVAMVLDQADGNGGRHRELRSAAWGLVPWWAEDRSGAARMINARSETVRAKPAYRAPLSRRRCLVPADGWFEWVAREGEPTRRPHFITSRDGSPLAFAGLYEWWDRGDEPLLSVTILTEAARGALTAVHHRMPVVVGADQWTVWLDPHDTDPGVPATTDETIAGLELRPVGRAVGDVRNGGPELVARHEPPAPLPGMEIETMVSPTLETT